MTNRRRVSERLTVSGVVQGVGFRPFVYRVATELGLDGIVGNDAAGVFIDVTGPVRAVERFTERLSLDAPPLARVDEVTRAPVQDPGHTGFRIVESIGDETAARTLVPPDTAPCDDCLAEMRDPDDRRAAHPFITCTNCGPRFTIIADLPYDRPATTMAGFEMCVRCRAEYEDPGDRRYHAQPISCHDCGPRLELTADGDDVERNDGPLVAAADLLRSGSVVAVKGVGGFQLACDATDDAAVGLVRARKHRPDKPFAVMVPDLDGARCLAFVDDDEADQLLSPARPIVLLRARPSELSRAVAPGNPLVGIMLPSTPIHHLLFDQGLPPLVMTSANLSGEPLVHRDDDAIERLSGLCDAVLTHDRPIRVPCDDSVVRLTGGTLLPVRRARGFAPLPIPVGQAVRSVLAVGGELKNACCVASTERAWMSQHIGDMENLETLTAFEQAVDDLTTMYRVEPDVVAVDAHPGYATSAWARRHHPDRLIEVQHHHAHIAAVMAEHELDARQPVIGIAFDGTGYGDDGTIWGGEVLIADGHGYERYSHLVPVSLPGGDAAVRHPNRIALSHVSAAGVDWSDDLEPLQPLAPAERDLLRHQLDHEIACVPTTSMGRLFDAVASLLGLRHEISYEAQAAIELEIEAARCARPIEPYSFGDNDGLIDQRPVVRSIVRDVRAGVDRSAIARAFHDGVADAVEGVARAASERHGIDVVALSGGVFQNAFLIQLCTERLERAGLVALTHHLVPPNDGGLALGQAFVAGHRALEPSRQCATDTGTRSSSTHLESRPNPVTTPNMGES